MDDDDQPENRLDVALNGMLSGAFVEAYGEMARELRRHAAGDYDATLNRLEARALKSVENVALDGFTEVEQIFMYETIRSFIAATFAHARKG